MDNTDKQNGNSYIVAINWQPARGNHRGQVDHSSNSRSDI